MDDGYESKNVKCITCESEYPETMLDDGVCVACQLKDDNDKFLERYNSEKPKKYVREETKEEIEERKAKRQALKDAVKKESKRQKKGRKSLKPQYLLTVENNVLPEEAKQDAIRDERVDRERARRFLLPFIERFSPKYEAGWFHKDLCRRLEQFSQDVAAKKSPRLMLFVPPRHGKSMTTSINFPAWHMGHHPDHEFIITSYASQLAMTFSKGVRELVADEAYKAVFPRTQMREDSKSVEHWLTTQGGGLLAAGVGGPMTGNGAHILIVDDPVKNAQEAESAMIRDGHEAWYGSTAYTRLAPGGGILFIMTRWNWDDLAGRLIAQMADGADQYDIVEYPAIALYDEPYRRKGVALHGERYDEMSLARIRKAVGERTWWSLYQQQPTPDEGSYFTRDMVRWYKLNGKDGRPEHPPLNELRIYAAWDFAIGKNERNDYTVGIVVGIDHLDRMFLLDLVRERLDADQIVTQILEVQKKWKPLMQGFEHGQIEMSIGPFMRKRQFEEKIHINEEILRVGRRDKEARARPIQGRMKQGMVFVPSDMWWSEVYLSELLQFPDGKHDDMVDTIAWIGQMFDTMARYKYPAADRSLTGWKEKLAKNGKMNRLSNKSAMSA